MIRDELLGTDFNDVIGLNKEMKDYLYEAAKWGKFLSIFGFMFFMFIVITALYSFFFMGKMLIANKIITIFCLVLSLIYLMPCLYLYRFSTKTRLALDLDSSMDLTKAFSHLKSLYKIWGFPILIMVTFSVLVSFFSLLFFTSLAVCDI